MADTDMADTDMALTGTAAGTPHGLPYGCHG